MNRTAAQAAQAARSHKQNRDKLKEARKRMAEKYGDDYDESDDDED